ncbi:MAG: 50S ribosomal protein L19 [Lentisphaeria bacterium]|nr:50S ribosomal protein L19 [Lentisphaeria bacterium]
MNPVIDKINKEQERTDLPEVCIGDTIKVNLRIVEGDKERIQLFQGTVIARDGSSVNESITVRRVSYGIGIERVLPLHSPKIDSIEVVNRGDVRRAKLYYLRDRVGKSARIKTKIGK